ncbi:MAG: hypothetical protein WC460_04035 [Patescibacteria group bacterium]
MPEDKILQKLEQHDQKFDAILGKLDEHDVKLDNHARKLESIDTKLEDHAIKLGSIDVKLDNHAKKLIEHDELLKPLCGDVKTLKTDVKNIANNQEQMITILKRLDEDRVFTHAWVKRIEKEVEDHSQEIKDMKLKLNIA